jgi:hypothetical protein
LTNNRTIAWTTEINYKKIGIAPESNERFIQICIIHMQASIEDLKKKKNLYHRHIQTVLTFQPNLNTVFVFCSKAKK